MKNIPQTAADHLGTVVEDKGTRYQIVDIRDPVDAPLFADEPVLVGETESGSNKSWGLQCFEQLDILTTALDAPERPDPVVEISVQEGFMREKDHYQENAVVRCRDCDELVREPHATPHMGKAMDAHDHDAWTCDACSSFEEAHSVPTLDVDDVEVDDSPYARWSDRLSAWTIGSDYRVDDDLWQPNGIESVSLDSVSSGSEHEDTPLVADGGSSECECVRCEATGDIENGIFVRRVDESNETVCNHCRAEYFQKNTVLKKRESDVAALKEQGFSHSEIGELLDIKKGTVDKYSQRITDRVRRATTTANELQHFA